MYGKTTRDGDEYLCNWYKYQSNTCYCLSQELWMQGGWNGIVAQDKLLFGVLSKGSTS